MRIFFDMLGRLALFMLLGVPGFALARLGKIEKMRPCNVGESAFVCCHAFFGVPKLAGNGYRRASACRMDRLRAFPRSDRVHTGRPWFIDLSRAG